MKKVPDFQNERIVLLIIDMQCEESPKGFWKAYNWDATVNNAQRVLEACRVKGYPIVHVKVARDPEGVQCHPFDLRMKMVSQFTQLKEQKMLK